MVGNTETMYKFTSIGRALDPRYPTNRAIMVFALVGGVTAGIIRLINGGDLVQAAIDGFFAGGMTFFGWGLAREIDPDREYSAFLAAGLAFIAALITPEHPPLFALAALVILARIVNRIVGLSAKVTDSLATLILTACAIFISGHWTFGLVATAAFALDALLYQPLRRQWIFAGIAAVLTLFYGITNSVTTPDGFTNFLLLGVLIVAGAYSVNIVTTWRVETLTDYTRTPIDVRRVQATMLIALLTGLVYLWYGDTGIWAMLPL